MSHVVSFRFWRINIISNIFRTFHIVLEENYIAITIVIELSPSPSCRSYKYWNNLANGWFWLQVVFSPLDSKHWMNLRWRLWKGLDFGLTHLHAYKLQSSLIFILSQCTLVLPAQQTNYNDTIGSVQAPEFLTYFCWNSEAPGLRSSPIHWHSARTYLCIH